MVSTARATGEGFRQAIFNPCVSVCAIITLVRRKPSGRHAWHWPRHTHKVQALQSPTHQEGCFRTLAPPPPVFPHPTFTDFFGVRVHRQLYRLQNPTQWDLYTTHRDRIVSQRQTAFDSDEKEPVNNIVPRTLQIMRQNKDFFGQFVMESGANEAYLFHGTRVSL